MQVPLRLATACCLVLGDHDLAAVPVADCPCGKTVGRIVWHAINQFIKVSGVAKMYTTGRVAVQCIDSFDQLEQSGVLQLLPDVLSDVADRLDAVFGAPPIAAGAAARRGKCEPDAAWGQQQQQQQSRQQQASSSTPCKQQQRRRWRWRWRQHGCNAGGSAGGPLLDAVGLSAAILHP
jgi:hypothetical protein